MVVLVTSLMAPTRRAERLLKLYPQIWRERYGGEFVDLMEQSIADRPHDAKRTTNIILKSVKVRLSDLGIAGPTLDNTNASRSALSTTTVLATVFTVFALFYWSSTMVSWNSNPNVATSVPVSLWTGAITVSTAILTLTLVGVGVIFLFRALKSTFLRRDKRFRWSLIAVFASSILILNAVHQYIRFTIARGGIQWFQFGQALKQVAGATQWVTQSVIWGPSWTGGSTFSEGLLHISTTVAVVVLAFSVAKLIRQSEFSMTATRAGARATKLLSMAMFLFLFSCAGWEMAGGYNNSWMAPFTQMEKSLFFVIAFIALLGLMTSLKVRNRDNSIEIVSSANEAA
jgi:hypothetical protein